MLDVILDKGLVIGAYVRISAVGIELLTIDARIVIASVDTYLKFENAVNRLDVSQQESRPSLLGAALGAVAAAGLAKRTSVTEPDGGDDSPDEIDQDQDGPSSEHTQEDDGPRQQDAGERPRDQNDGDDRAQQQGSPDMPIHEKLDARTVREQVLNGYFEQLTEDKYYDVVLMNRVERMIETSDELKRYLAILLERVGSEKFVSGDMRDRLERLISALRQMEPSQLQNAQRGA